MLKTKSLSKSLTQCVNYFIVSIAQLLFLIFALSSCSNQTDQFSYAISSPDGRLTINVMSDSGGYLDYSVSYEGHEVIKSSDLGLELKEGGVLGKHMQVTETVQETFDETYDVVVGKSDSARNYYNTLLIKLEETDSSLRKMNIELRAYNDGVAFRYIVPDQNSIQIYDLRDELTSIILDEEATTWLLDLEKFDNNYEDVYIRSAVMDINDSALIGLPLSFRIPGVCEGAITEANLKDYAGMYLRKSPDSKEILLSEFPPHFSKPDLIVESAQGFRTPWRVFMLADELNDLIASDIVMNLNDPCEIEDTEWIKAGLTAWDWWSSRTVKSGDFEGGMNNQTMKYYIDFAHDFGLEYMLVDAGWYGDNRDPGEDVTTTIDEINIPELVHYSSEKDVDLILWLNYEHLLPKVDEAFALYNDWGIKGVKIDYMDRDDQEMVELYEKMVKTAAKYNLLVDFHGSYKPTGIRRTWPNLLTREGVMGLEHLKWGDAVTPDHNVIIPFTRMLVGPMDYTPGGFDNTSEDDFTSRYEDPVVMGTRCHQLAMYVVYESPLQMVSDHPDAYRGEPGADFLKSVPASWDETFPLEGKVGEYIVLARRAGDKWYVGAMTGSDLLEIKIALPFLNENKSYKVVLYEDAKDSGTNPKNLEISERTISSKDSLDIRMVEGGGMVAIIE